MPLQLLIWLLAFIMQSGLLGVSMYQLVQLTDLEADYVNPHDASKNYNRLVIPDYAGQVAITALHLLSGNWIMGAIQGIVLAYNVQQFRLGRHKVDVTEVFRDVSHRRKTLTTKMVFHLLLFVWTIYRFIEIVVLALITPAGRTAARSILREAAASLHRRR